MDNKKLKCKFKDCKQTFTREFARNRHYGSAKHAGASARRYKCKFCEYASNREGHRDTHMKRMHGDDRIQQPKSSQPSKAKSPTYDT